MLLSVNTAVYSGGINLRVSAKNVYSFSGLITEVKVKVQFTLEQATKAQRGSRGIALLFL
jgi:hypothetical protein